MTTRPPSCRRATEGARSRPEYKQLVDEAVPSLFFYSNFPSVHSAGYFDFRTKFRFLLHTWSLSTELQFYAVVPALMLVLARLRRLHPACGHLFLVLISAASFYRQTHPASELSAHMSLDGRVWEFMAGFFAHFAHDSKLLDFKGRLRSVFSFFFDYGFVCLLLVSLAFNLPLDGFLLIGLSIFLGFLVEKFFERLLLLIGSWRSLLVVLFVSYAAVGCLMVRMERNAMTLVEEKPLSKAEEEHRFQTTLELWRTRNDTQPFPNNRTLQLNQEIAYRALTCHNNTRWLPTSFGSIATVGAICNEHGSGTKNVVVIGNSHAFVPFLGIAHAFRPIAAKITLVATGSCTPLTKWSGLKPVSSQETFLWLNKTLQKLFESCKRYIEQLLQILKGWKEPIDIAILNFAYVSFWAEQDLPLAADPKEDRMLQDLKAFYSAVSNVAREAVLIGGVNLEFEENPLQTLQQALLANKTVGRIGETRKNMTKIR
ncbi:Acyltransferase [Aphelenchoides fujianensis]|nr:Acyltransferase [Aphelenchoides fujianensis]